MINLSVSETTTINYHYSLINPHLLEFDVINPFLPQFEGTSNSSFYKRVNVIIIKYVTHKSQWNIYKLEMKLLLIYDLTWYELIIDYIIYEYR